MIRIAGWLRCGACNHLMRRSLVCSDLAVLTLHWMSEHREKWLEMHPGDAEWIGE